MGKNTIIKDALALLVITLVSGLCLGYVFSITKQPIADAQEKAKQEAYKKVFPDAAGFQENDSIKSALKGYEADGAEVTEVLEAVDGSGTVMGHVVAMTAKEGYGGDITLSMGIASDGTITGLEVLTMSETAGLGAKCTDDSPEGFKAQFAGKINASECDYEVSFGDGGQFDQISSATITSRAITKALNASLGFVKTLQ